MEVNMNGLRKNLCRAFNEYVAVLDDTLEANEALAELRQHIAMLLLVYEKGNQGFIELDPDKLLVEIKEGQK